MKAHREPPKFTPVTLVLETQEEVDAIFSLLNDRRITEPLGLEGAWKELFPFKSPREDLFSIKCAILSSLLK